MGYAETEQSLQDGRPVELVAFASAATTWRYAMCAYNVSYGGYTYQATAGLDRGEIEDSTHPIRTLVDYYLPWSASLVQQYITSSPDGVVTVTAIRGHDPDYQVFWRGFVKAVPLQRRGHRMQVQCTSARSDIASGIILRTGRACMVPLYSPLCGLDRDDFATPGTVVSVDGCTVTSSTFATQADGYWTGGPFVANGRERMVVQHEGSTVILSHVLPGLTAGATFAVHAGCTHLYACCRDRFANRLNYKGQPPIPDDTPWATGVF